MSTQTNPPKKQSYIQFNPWKSRLVGTLVLLLEMVQVS
jgi:hypothetical protein